MLLLGRSPDFLPWLRWVVLLVGLRRRGRRSPALRLPAARLAALAAAAASSPSSPGPAAYAVHTAATAHTGSIPTAGPTGAGSGGPGGRWRPGGGPAAAPAVPGPAPQGRPRRQAPPAAARPAAARGGGAGGLLNGSTPERRAHRPAPGRRRRYTWVAAAVGSNNASGYQLATEHPVMAIGGFNGTDPTPTLAQFQQYVADGEIHWFIGSGAGFGQSTGGSDAQQRDRGLGARHFTATPSAGSPSTT